MVKAVSDNNSDVNSILDGAARVSIDIRPRRFMLAKTRAEVSRKSNYQCCFPGCDVALSYGGSAFIGQIASIYSLSLSGPRFSSEKTGEYLLSEDNFLLLCPNHHGLIDMQPETYSAEWLREARDKHYKKVLRAFSASRVAKPALDDLVELSLSKALEVWEENQDNNNEEFWQELFEKAPAVLAQIFPQSVFQLGSKCYVGGKSISNSGGNLADFIYANKKSGNVVIIEIKTPASKLLGKKYRQNCYSVSEELSGAIVQALNYKDELTKNYHQLSSGDGGQFSAFNPKCVVIAGSIDDQMLNSVQLKSFELLRSSLHGVEVVTYDELFLRVQEVLEILG